MKRFPDFPTVLILLFFIFVLADYFFLGMFIPDGFRWPAEIDGKIGNSIMEKHFPGEKTNQHSYVRNPSVGRRELRDQLYVFEMPKTGIDAILKVGYQEMQVSSLVFEQIPTYLLQDVDRKLSCIAKKKKYIAHVFSPKTILYVKRIGGSDPFEEYILVDESGRNKNNYFIAIDMPSSVDFNNKIIMEINTMEMLSKIKKMTRP